MGNIDDLESVQELKKAEKLLDKKVCSKCGNEILEGNKFCSKCGQAVYENSDKQNDNNINKKEPIKIKLNHLLLGIGLIIIVIVIVDICINMNNNKNVPQQSTNVFYNNTTSQQASSKLSIIDEENKELKINANSLINAIIKANKDKAESDRELFLEYTRKLEVSSGNYRIYSIR